MSYHYQQVLSANNLSYQYGKMVVWESVDLDVERGEIVFLVGENGSGKSTLLRCLAGLASPHSGKLFLSGEHFTGQSRKQRSQISFVSDTPSFYDDMTAEEHLRFILQANRRIEEYPSVIDLFERFGLIRHIKQYPSSYSRGMRQKLALILALAVHPQLLLLDEPYNPLDYKAARVLTSELTIRASQGASIILSSHRLITELQPSKVFLLEDGRLSQRDASLLAEVWDDRAGTDGCDTGTSKTTNVESGCL